MPKSVGRDVPQLVVYFYAFPFMTNIWRKITLKTDLKRPPLPVFMIVISGQGEQKIVGCNDKFNFEKWEKEQMAELKKEFHLKKDRAEK